MRNLESLDHFAPLPVKETRKLLAARKEPCLPTCKGWEVIDSNAHGLMIQRCDECFGSTSIVFDDDMAQLPEALDALAIARSEANAPPMRLVFTVKVVTDVGFQAVENAIRRALDEAEAFTYSLGGCTEEPIHGELPRQDLPRCRRG